jgi:hypothetical protein
VRAALRVLVVRAFVGFVMLRVLLVIVAALMAEFAGAAAADSLQNPLGAIVIAAAVGAADLRRRGETMFWANFGFPAYVTPALWAASAVLGESALALAFK